MKLRNAILVAVMQIVAMISFSTQALAGAVVVTTTTNSSATSLGVWNGPGSATTTQAATVQAGAVCDGACFQATINKAYAFSYAATLTLPLLNAVFEGHTFDATFVATTTTHENWHDRYARALLASTYGRLITWSETYTSNRFQTMQQAVNAGNADLANALTAAAAAFTADFSTDVTNPAFGHQNAVAFKTTVDGIDVWRSKNPDWGQPAVTFAEGITVAFTKTAGNCECVPEPGSGVLFAFGIIGFAVARSVRRRQPQARTLIG